MKEHFYAEQGKTSRYSFEVFLSFLYNVSIYKLAEIWENLFGFRKDNSKVKELFEKIGKLREEFESIERPNLEVETPPSEEPESPGKQDAENPKEEIQTPLTKEKEILSSEKPQESHSRVAEAPETKKKELPESPQGKGEQVLDAEAELAKLESEFGNRDYNDEIGDWEFDELERELRAGDSSTSK